MAYGNQTVWLATENSPRVSVYHATTGEFLMEIDLKPIVIQSLRSKSPKVEIRENTIPLTFFITRSASILSIFKKLVLGASTSIFSMH